MFVLNYTEPAMGLWDHHLPEWPGSSEAETMSHVAVMVSKGHSFWSGLYPSPNLRNRTSPCRCSFRNHPGMCASSVICPHSLLLPLGRFWPPYLLVELVFRAGLWLVARGLHADIE